MNIFALFYDFQHETLSNSIQKRYYSTVQVVNAINPPAKLTWGMHMQAVSYT